MYYKLIEVIDLDLSESTERYYNILLRGIRDNEFDTDDVWWVIFDSIDEKIYGYEYIADNAKGLSYNDYYPLYLNGCTTVLDDCTTAISNVYIYKTPEYGKLVDNKLMYLEEYIVNDNTLIESCKKEVIESML